MIQIANPSFDVVFKYLMADIRAAKILLSTLLGDEIEILELLPQERSVSFHSKEPKQNPNVLSVIRFDYCATLKIKDEKKKVLIELQKGKNDIDIARFRRYLGKNYDTKEQLAGQEEVLPIIAVYLFGFDMDGIEPAVTRFHPVGTDLIENIPFTYGKSEIVECLTHTSFFVQLNKLPTKSKNRVGKVLSVFSQHWIKDDKKILSLPDNYLEDEGVRILVDRLQHALLDSETQRQLIEEDEYQKIVEKNMKKSEEKGIEKGIGIGERKKAIETAKNLKKLGIPNATIAQATGLSEEDIESL
jgi:predicted transposase/invertase (TIGR01784 family)